MYDNNAGTEPAPVSAQIRALRQARRWSLSELARRAGTSAPALHRYESGWDRFELGTLRKIAAALEARVDLRLVPRRTAGAARRPSRSRLLSLIAPLFWDRRLVGRDLDAYPAWVLGRVLMFGGREQVAAVRSWYGDHAVREAVRRRGIDSRTRNYWNLVLGALEGKEGEEHAPQGPER